MATFANQASNLGALESKFNRLLKIRNLNDESDGDLRRKGADTKQSLMNFLCFLLPIHSE